MTRLTEAQALEIFQRTEMSKGTLVFEYADGARLEVELPRVREIAVEEITFGVGAARVSFEKDDKTGALYVLKAVAAPLKIGDWVKWADHPDALPMRAEYVASAAQDARGVYWSLRTSNGYNIGAFEKDLVRVDPPAPTQQAKFEEGDIVLVPAHRLSNSATPRAHVVVETEWRWESGGYWRYVLEDRDGKFDKVAIVGAEADYLTKLRQWPFRVGDFARWNQGDERLADRRIGKVVEVTRTIPEHPDHWNLVVRYLDGREMRWASERADQVDVKVTKSDRKVHVTYDEKWEVQA